MADKNSQIDDGVTSSGDVSRVQDVLVTAIVALIGSAVALGVYVQAGFGLVPSLCVGSGLFVWLLSAHFLITRNRLKKIIDGRLTQLDRDVSKLKKEAEITDVLAEGHNELATGQEALEKAIQVIVGRVDKYDNRLKALYKLSKQQGQQPNIESDLEGQEQRYIEMQDEMKGELQRLALEIQTFENRFDESSHQQFSLIKAELDVLELVVHQINVADDEIRAQFSQKALQVIGGLRQMPVMKELGTDEKLQVTAGVTSELNADLKIQQIAKASALALSAQLPTGGIATDDFMDNERGGLNGGELGLSVKVGGADFSLDEKSLDSNPLNSKSLNSKSVNAPAEQSEENLLAAISDAIAGNRIELYMQPIVGLPDRDLVYYETFARLRNDVGQMILPKDFIAASDIAGLTPIIDNQIILLAIQVVQRLVARGNAKVLFCNISMASLRDADFFAEFMDFMEANQWLREHLVFEFTQEALDGAGAYEYERLAAISKLGFKFSLDRISRLDIDFKALSEMNFGFVKIGASLLLGNLEGAQSEIHPADLNAYLARLNLVMIIDNVEREALVRQLRDYNVSYAQGTLFCEPKPVRPEVFDQQQAEVA